MRKNIQLRKIKGKIERLTNCKTTNNTYDANNNISNSSLISESDINSSIEQVEKIDEKIHIYINKYRSLEKEILDYYKDIQVLLNEMKNYKRNQNF